MIVYFTDRDLNVIGLASSHLITGHKIVNDSKVEDVEAGVDTLELDISFTNDSRMDLEWLTSAGHYILTESKGVCSFYTIIESEIDTERHNINIYSEDAGLDLLNEILQPKEYTEANTVDWYILQVASDSGFTIGVNEIPNTTKKILAFQSEQTATARLMEICELFDNCELKFSFEVTGLKVTKKIINIYKKRGSDFGYTLRYGEHFSGMTIRRSVANVATALLVSGGYLEGAESYANLIGYTYDDGDMYVSGQYIMSRKALLKWNRYYLGNTNHGNGGHIERPFVSDKTIQRELCDDAIIELKKRIEPEVNYSVDILKLPENVNVGDTVTIIDDIGEIYVSARILRLTTSESNERIDAVLGDYLIKDSGINSKVEELASKFADISAAREFYTWVIYADDSIGTNMSEDSTGKDYMGIAPNRLTSTPNLTDASLYKWSKITGSSGDGINGIFVYYLASATDSGVTIDTPGWSDTVPTINPTNRYLWLYERITYTSGRFDITQPRVVGAYGSPGPPGVPGTPAPTIISMVEQYAMSTSSTDSSGLAWGHVIPEWSSGLYLWTRWVTRWSSPNPDEYTISTPVVSKTWNELRDLSQSALDNAAQAQENANDALTNVGLVNDELIKANTEINSVKENLQYVENTMSTEYATKGELTEVNLQLGTSISQNADNITTIAGSVTKIEIDAGKAIEDANNAVIDAENARLAAIEANNKYTELKQQADVTDAELETAKNAVDKATQDAAEALAAAASAVAGVSGLANRVETCESAIVQNAESITQTVSKVVELQGDITSVNESLTEYVDTSVSSVIQTAESIIFGVTENMVTEDQFETYKETLSSTFMTTAKGAILETSIASNKTSVDNAVKDITEQKQYIRLEEGNIIIGKSDSAVTSKFTNNALEFRHGDTIVAQFTTDSLIVNNIKANSQFQLSDKWVIRLGLAGSGGYNLNDIWVG